MDAVVQGLIREGGGWLAAALVLVILIGAVKIAQVLLKREWDRGDRQDKIITQVANSSDKLVQNTDKLALMAERLIEGQRSLERQIDSLRQRAG